MRRFDQVDKVNWDDWLSIAIESPSALRVWLRLVRLSDRGNRVVFNDKDLMVSAKVSRRALFYALATLAKCSMIKREGAFIHLNSTLIWSGRQADLKMAHLKKAVVFEWQKPIPRENIKLG